MALSLVHSDDRCTWEGLRELLYDDSDRGWYNSLSCPAQSVLNTITWWLADPLYITDGNERKAAHFYRHIFATLFSESVKAMPPFIGSSLIRQPIGLGRLVRVGPSFNPRQIASLATERELFDQVAFQSLIRGIGVPAFTMLGIVADSGNPPQFLLQYRQPTYHFIPALSAVQNPMSATVDSWNLDDEDASERYHPNYGIFTPLDFQIAYFRRGDSARVIAAADIAGNPMLIRSGGRQLLSSALVLTTGPDDIRIYRDSIPGTNVTFDSRVPAESTIVSLESLAAGVGAGRVRFASGPPPMPRQRVTLSDILLVQHTGTLPTNLEEAAPRTLPTTNVPLTTGLDLYFELYGLRMNDTVTYSLTVEEGRRSAGTRIGRFLGILGGATGAGVQWTELVSSEAAVTPRSLTLDISQLNRGSHVLKMEIAVPGQDTVRVEREMQIVR
jgi:hypothetical protein